jgi:hypothetical protein
VSSISEIKLIGTDTTLDLSQKAEKVCTDRECGTPSGTLHGSDTPCRTAAYPISAVRPCQALPVLGLATTRERRVPHPFFSLTSRVASPLLDLDLVPREKEGRVFDSVGSLFREKGGGIVIGGGGGRKGGGGRPQGGKIIKIGVLVLGKVPSNPAGFSYTHGSIRAALPHHRTPNGKNSDAHDRHQEYEEEADQRGGDGEKGHEG